MAIENLWFRYVFTKTSTFFIKTEQRVKINDVYSSWIEIVFMLPKVQFLAHYFLLYFFVNFFGCS